MVVQNIFVTLATSKHYKGDGNESVSNPFVIEPLMGYSHYTAMDKVCTVPPVVVDVVVTVKLKDRENTFVYSGEFLPEIEFLPSDDVKKWLDLYYRVKLYGPSYYQKYPDQNPTYKFHIQHMRDKMECIYPEYFTPIIL